MKHWIITAVAIGLLVSSCKPQAPKKKAAKPESSPPSTESAEKPASPPKKKKVLGKVNRKIQDLLDKNGDVNKYVDKITPLGWAVNHNDPELVRTLLNRGAEVDKFPAERATWTPLFDAIHGVQISHPDDRDRIVKNSQKVLAALVKHKANVNHQTRIKETPLQKAAQQGRADVCAFLMRSGAKPDTPDGLGRTALHIAAKNGYYKVVRVLLKRGAKRNLKDRMGKTPLQLAQEKPNQSDYDDLRKDVPYMYPDADYEQTIALLK